MLNNVETIVMISIFVILLVVIFKPIKSVYNFNIFPSYVLSVCISVLCIIGMGHFLKGSFGIILLPYTVLGITVILMALVPFFYKYLNKNRILFGDHLNNKKHKIDKKNIRKQPHKRKRCL